MAKAGATEKAVREIRRQTRRRFSAEEKIRIVLEGLRGEESIAVLCRREGLAPNLYYRWSKEFLEAGKKRLLGDTTREATSTEVQDLRRENSQLKQVVAETVLENRVLKKICGPPARRTIRARDDRREARGHPVSRGVGALGPAHAPGARRPPVDLLRVVSALPDGGGRWTRPAAGGGAATLESDSTPRAAAGRGRRARRSGEVAPGASAVIAKLLVRRRTVWYLAAHESSCRIAADRRAACHIGALGARRHHTAAVGLSQSHRLVGRAWDAK